MNVARELWESKRYRNMAKKCVKDQEELLRWIRDNDGKPSGR